MRTILLIAIMFSFTVVRAQTALPFASANYSKSEAFANNIHPRDSLSTGKWFFSTYRSISTGISFFNGGNATMFSAPMGLRLNRRLNNNFYAFANVMVAPTYINFNRSFTATGVNKTFGYNTGGINGFGVYPAASVGLMYINDQKTFSISGSISAERNSYPLLPYYPGGNFSQSTRISARK